MITNFFVHWEILYHSIMASRYFLVSSIAAEYTVCFIIQWMTASLFDYLKALMTQEHRQIFATSLSLIGKLILFAAGDALITWYLDHTRLLGLISFPLYIGWKAYAVVVVLYMTVSSMSLCAAAYAAIKLIIITYKLWLRIALEVVPSILLVFGCLVAFDLVFARSLQLNPISILFVVVQASLFICMISLLYLFYCYTVWLLYISRSNLLKNI